jgi:hypothetical protein
MAKRLELRKLGLHKAKLESRGGGPPRQSENEFDDPADLAIDTRHPIAEMNESVRVSELADICEAFAAALHWAGQAKSLVEMGWRMSTMLHLLRPALVEGMALELKIDLARQLAEAMGGKRAVITEVGSRYRKVLAWVRRCSDLVQLGQRGFAMIYLIDRRAIGGATNATLGGMDDKTRQAFNRIVGDGRDSLSGFRNEVMRGEETRKRCRISNKSGS